MRAKVAVVGGAAGPTVLLLAGTSGDEIDSQIALARVAQRLDPATMNGRVIVMPMANEPAARAGRRNSPVDGRNLNRSFPGDVLGTATAIIADYIERQLVPLSDLVLDLHSDGRSIRYLPCATLIHHPDPDIRARRMAVAMAFGAPAIVMFYSFEDRNTSGAARRAGTVRIATEIGGPDPVGMTVAGVMRVLGWAGIIDGAAADVPIPSVYAVQDRDFVYALHDGVFEQTAALGDVVSEGGLAGFIHDVSRPFTDPVEIRFPAPGTVVCTRGGGLAARGDCVIHLGARADPELDAELAAAAGLRWLATQIAPRPAKRVRRSRPA